MSGDIGAGTTTAAVNLAQKVLAAGLPGYVQLAGGTNNYTVAKLKASGLLNTRRTGNSEFLPQIRGNGDWELGTDESSSPSPSASPQSLIAGVAYGSYARVLMSPVLDELEKVNRYQLYGHTSIEKPLPNTGRLEDVPSLLWQAVELANSLVKQLKSSVNSKQQRLSK
jgi:hypothetical protein